ncbi:MAG: GCN5-related N-acetyltransferase [Bacteroidota bacterium]|nr:GCN5-related N-acetyltransferase [Bacteroidota bacterium]
MNRVAGNVSEKEVKLNKMKTSYKPLTKETWKDFEILFGSNGACGGCWCMWWKLGRKDFAANKGDGNKKLIRSIAEKKLSREYYCMKVKKRWDGVLGTAGKLSAAGKDKNDETHR